MRSTIILDGKSYKKSETTCVCFWVIFLNVNKDGLHLLFKFETILIHSWTWVHLQTMQLLERKQP